MRVAGCRAIAVAKKAMEWRRKTTASHAGEGAVQLWTQAIDHAPCGPNLGLPYRGGRFHIDDDRVVDILGRTFYGLHARLFASNLVYFV